jgi:hypothetical protein
MSASKYSCVKRKPSASFVADTSRRTHGPPQIRLLRDLVAAASRDRSRSSPETLCAWSAGWPRRTPMVPWRSCASPARSWPGCARTSANSPTCCRSRRAAGDRGERRERRDGGGARACPRAVCRARRGRAEAKEAGTLDSWACVSRPDSSPAPTLVVADRRRHLARPPHSLPERCRKVTDPYATLVALGNCRSDVVLQTQTARIVGTHVVSQR